MRRLELGRQTVRWFRIALAAAGLGGAALLQAGVAQQLIPTPDFADHAIPIAAPPPPDAPWWEYLNLAVLVGALALASYFALVSRSRRGLFLLAIGSVIWFGFLRYGCICPVGSTQNVVQGLCDPGYAVPLTVVGLFALPLVFTLFFGRTFCAAVCPLGAVQELVAVRSVRVPRWLDDALGVLPYIYLGVAVIFAASGTAYLICRYDPFVGFFRLGGDFSMLLFGGAMLGLSVFVGRPYCRYLCPYGGLLALLSLVSWRHARIPPEECIQCRLCEDACPYGAIREPTVPLPQEARPWARLRLAAMLLAVPALIVLVAVVGILLATAFSKLDPQVRLAERIKWEDAQQVAGTTEASEAFRNTGRPTAALFAEAVSIRERFRTLGGWVGGWVGLVFGVRLVTLSIRRRRTEWTPDRARCVSCARCYWYCPCEQVRLGLIDDVHELVKDLPHVGGGKKPEGDRG